MRRRQIGAMVLAAGAMALGLTATGGAQGQAQGERTIVLYGNQEHGSFRYVDAKPFTRVGRGPQRVSAGDGVILRIPEYSNAARTIRAGTAYAHCTAMNSSRRFHRARFHCQGEIVFRDGQVVIEGFAQNLTANTRVAVTGGTGAYEGARGQVTLGQSQGGGTVTIHLLEAGDS